MLKSGEFSGVCVFVFQIHSDKASEQTKILYYITGPGVDLPPQRRFSVDANTGFVKVHEILDREEYASYHVRALILATLYLIWNIFRSILSEEMLKWFWYLFLQLKGIAKFTDGTLAEKYIDLNITVEDANDNPPIIQANQIGYVNESSAAGNWQHLKYVGDMASEKKKCHFICIIFFHLIGTSVMTIIATDADEPNTIRSQIRYSIVEDSNSAGMFYINYQTGEVMVRKNTLDREVRHLFCNASSSTTNLMSQGTWWISLSHISLEGFSISCWLCVHICHLWMHRLVSFTTQNICFVTPVGSGYWKFESVRVLYTLFIFF